MSLLNKMDLTRRQFLTLMGGSATAVAAAACGVPEKELLVQAPLEMPEDLVTGLDNWYATIDRQNRNGIGIVVRVMEGRAKKIEGNVDYPVNVGKHNAIADAGVQSLYHPDRISAPLVRTGERGEGNWEEISWTDAVSRIASRLEGVSGEELVLVTSPIGGHMGSVVNSFTDAFGSTHLQYEPLERTVLQASIKNVFGQDVMPDFDIENAAYVLSFGADFLNGWVSPVRFGRGYGDFRHAEGRERGTFTHIESRLSMTAANADDWIYVKPGYEGVLALSMAKVIIDEGLGDDAAVASLTQNGTNDLSQFDPSNVSAVSGVPAQRIREIAHEFATKRPAVAIGGGSAAAHTNGLFNLNAVHSLNYLVGNVNKKGGVIFTPMPPIGLPVGSRSSSFQQMSTLSDRMANREVKALFVREADPFYGMPSSSEVRKASFGVDLIVSFSGQFDDTTAMADIVLPEHNYLEDWGTDVPDPGPGYQVVGFQQPVVRPFFENRGGHLGTKNFGDVLITLGEILSNPLSLPGDDVKTFKDVVEQGARSLYGLNRGSVKSDDFRSFWQGVLQRGGWWDTGARYDGPSPTPPALPVSPQEPISGSGEFALVPFESAGLSDGRTSDLPWLQALPDPISTAVWHTWVEINNKKAEEMDIREGDVVEVTSPRGSIKALAYPHPGISPDAVAVPIGGGHLGGGRYSKERGSNVFSILEPLTDDKTGALAWGATRVSLRKTGDWVRLSKFENTKPDISEDTHRKIIPLTKG